MKPTRTQAEICAKLANGWELGYCTGSRSGGCWWMQEGGIACGGEAVTVRVSTFRAMREQGLIEEASKSYPFTRYRLTEAGNAAAQEAQ